MIYDQFAPDVSSDQLPIPRRHSPFLWIPSEVISAAFPALKRSGLQVRKCQQ